MAALTAGIMALSALTTAYGQYKAGQGAQAQGNYEGRILDANAGLAEQQARDATAIGVEQEQRARRTTRGVIGAQRAGFAASGVDVGSGSAAGVQADSAALGELDALTIRNNAARQAWGYGVQAQNDRQQAALARQGGRNAAGSLGLQAGATLLTGAVDTYGTYKRFSTAPGGGQ